MKAVILSAGRGTRLRPFTEITPKPLLLIAGKPLLSYLLEALPSIGVTEVCLIVGYAKEKIEAYYRENKPPVVLSYLEQREQLGTAHALKYAKEFVGDDQFILVYGDVLISQVAWKMLFTIYNERAADGLMALYRVENPMNLGIVETQGNYVQAIIEKPERVPQTALINAGVFILPPAIFKSVEATEASPRGEYELTDSLEIFMRQGNRLTWYELEKWLTIGMPWDLLDANQTILTEMATRSDQEGTSPLKIEGQVDDRVTLIGPVEIRKNAHIRAGAYIIGPTLIDEGAVVGPNCYIRPYTYIGK